MTARDPGKAKDDFLGRWSRLKRERAASEGAVRPSEDAPAPPAASEPAAEPEPRSDAEILAELGLPHPEMLKPGDDFSAFMAKAVPEHLRRLALRRLWVSNPVLACLDDLVDYAEDYTDAALAVSNLGTGYKVGRGFLTDDDAAPKPGPAHPEPGLAADDAVAAPDVAGTAGDGEPGRRKEPASSAPETPETGAGATEPSRASSSVRAPGDEVTEAGGEGSADDPEPAAPEASRRDDGPMLARRAKMRFRQAD